MACAGPLTGLRVLELGQLLAGPWAATLLGYLGAEVIKVESPEGDPIRTWRTLDESGTSYWFRSIGRNKACVTLNLRTEEGRALAAQLIEKSDVLIENFRPGRMEAWGLGPDRFSESHARLVYARVSGYGQTGPYRERPGYASVTEAFGGLRHLTGTPGEPSVRSNLSLGDTLAGLHTALGVLAALYERGERDGRGQTVDVALYEAVYSCLESVVVEHGATGVSRGPSGATVTGIVPSNAYPCAGGRSVVIGANGESLFQRLMRAIGRGDLADDERFVGNPARVQHAAEIDGAIAEWTASRTVGQVVDVLVEAEVPCGPIQDAADMRRDPHFIARSMVESVDGFDLPAISPRLSRTPGQSRWAGRALGADTATVLCDVLGLDAERIADLRRAGVL